MTQSGASGGLAAGPRLRAMRADPDRVGRLAIATLGFLPLVNGSGATVLYFAACALVLVLCARGRIRWLWTPVPFFGCMVALGYFASVLGTALLAPRPLLGLLDAGTALHYLVLPLLTGALIQRPGLDILDPALNGLRAGALVSAVMALVQIAVLEHPRATGGMSNAIPFGDVALLAAGLSMVGFSRLSGRMKAFAVLASFAGLLGCFLSQTRGAWLALPLVLAVVAVQLAPLARRYPGRAALVAALVAVAIVLVGVAARAPERLSALAAAMAQPDVLRSEDRSIADRAIYLRFGLEALAERPVLGYGPQNAVPEVRRRAMAAGLEAPTHTHLHNEYLDAAVSSGLVGLIAMLALLAAPLVVAARSARDGLRGDRLAFSVLLTGGYAIFALTNTVFGQDELNTVFAILTVVALVENRRSRV